VDSPDSSQPPTSVRLAARLMLAYALVSALAAATAGLARQHLDSAGRAYLKLIGAVDHDAANQLISDVRWDLTFHLVVSIAGVLVIGGLSIAVRRPMRVARIAATAAAAVLAGLLGLVLIGSPETLTTPGQQDPPALRAALNDLLLGGYPTITSVLTVAAVGLSVAYTVFLFRDGASDFYRGSRADGEVGLWNYVPKSDRS